MNFEDEQLEFEDNKADEYRRATALHMALARVPVCGYFDTDDILRSAKKFEDYMREGVLPSKECETGI